MMNSTPLNWAPTAARYSKYPQAQLPEAQTIFSSSDQASTKKRPTSHACDTCRRRKSKCDGSKPACHACVNVYQTVCTYGEVDHTNKTSKKAPEPSAQVVPTAIESLGNVIDSLLTTRSCDDDLIAQLIDSQKRLKNCMSKSTEASPSPSISRKSSFNQTARKSSRRPLRRQKTQEDSARKVRFSKVWFDDNDDNFDDPPSEKLVRMLLNLYLEAHHPLITLFSAVHFQKDYENGVNRFCSKPLVYAILSVACCYHTDSEDQFVKGLKSIAGLGDQLFAAALKDLESNNHASLTSIQAWAILSTRQAAQGLEEHCYSLHSNALRGALGTNLHLVSETGQMGQAAADASKIRPSIKSTWMRSPDANSVQSQRLDIRPQAAGLLNMAHEALAQFPERRDSHVCSPKDPHCTARDYSTIASLGGFCQLLRDIDLPLYDPECQVGIEDLKNATRRLEAWSDEVICLYPFYEASPAHILVLLMYFQQAGLQLFRPFRDYDLSSLDFNAARICTLRTNEIIALWRALKSRFGPSKTNTMALWPLRDAMHALLHQLPDSSAIAKLSELAVDLKALSPSQPAAGKILAWIHAQALQLRVMMPDHLRLHLHPMLPPPLPMLGSDAFALRARLSPELQRLHVGNACFVPPYPQQMVGPAGEMLPALDPQLLLGNEYVSTGEWDAFGYYGPTTLG